MSDPTVATTIIEQIGRWNMIGVGARDRVYGDDYVTFTVGDSRGSIRKITVRLNGDDTYSVAMVSINRRTYDIRVVASMEGVYAENVGEVVYDMYSDHC